MNMDFNPQELKHLDSGRIDGYRLLLDFYNGQQWSGQASSREKRLTFNYVRVILDKLTSYLIGGMQVNLSATGATAAGKARARRAERALRRVEQTNSLEQLDFDTELDCAVLGDAAYKVTWDSTAGRVRVSSPDVNGLYAWWRADDVSQLWRVASRYWLSAAEAAVLYGTGSRNRQVAVTEVWTDDIFELWLENSLLERKPNPYAFIPFVLMPNLRQPKKFWGQSDIPALMEPQRELNRALSQLSHILELSGNPIAVLENVESSEDIAVRPGAVWNLPEEAKAYLLDLLQGGGVNLHLGYIELLYRTLHDIAESPRAAFGSNGQDLSGVALEMELQPLLQKIWRKRLIRQAVYRKRTGMILRLLQQYGGEDCSGLDSLITWSAVLPRDTTRVASAEESLVQNGIHSRRRAMGELGVEDPDTEFGRWLEERAAILRMNREMNTRSGQPHNGHSEGGLS
jgi:hypothetical protein